MKEAQTTDQTPFFFASPPHVILVLPQQTSSCNARSRGFTMWIKGLAAMAVFFFLI